MELFSARLCRMGALAAALVVGSALIVPRADAATAKWQEEGEVDSWANIQGVLFDDKPIADGEGVISMETPYRAMDAAVVPITIKAAMPQSKEDYIKTITLVLDENPSPVAAVFHMTPENGIATLTTRVRVDKYTYVRAIAEKNDGSLYMVANFVKAAGGCSAPGLKDKEAAMARLGKMKMKFLEASIGGAPGKAQLLVSHPNYSGLQFDQISRTEIPAHYINSIVVRNGDKVLFSVEPDISISEDPSIHFYYSKDTTGEFNVEATDTEGATFKKSWPIVPHVEG